MVMGMVDSKLTRTFDSVQSRKERYPNIPTVMYITPAMVQEVLTI